MVKSIRVRLHGCSRLLASALLVAALVLSPSLARAQAVPPGEVNDAVFQPALALGTRPALADGFPAFEYANPQAPKGGRLVFGAQGSFDSLNPFLLRGLGADGLGTLVFESLMARHWDEPFAQYGLLADGVALDADGLGVRFRLRPEARFSNGTAVQPKAVCLSWQALIAPESHPGLRSYYGDVQDCVAEPERVVHFRFRTRNPELPLLLGEMPVFAPEWWQASATNPGGWAESGRRIPIGSGPYLLDSFQPGKGLKFRRNPDWWARELPVRVGQFNFDQIEYRYFRDPSVQLEAFKAREFDLFIENNSKRWARDHGGPAYRDGRIRKAEIPHHNNAGMQGFVFNLRRSYLQDWRVREALILAFDFEWSNANLFYGLYRRNDSYFSNSELAATSEPTPAELALLEPHREALNPETVGQVLGAKWQPPVAGTAASRRANLLQAMELLERAGWSLREGQLVNAAGEPLRLRMLLAQDAFSRVIGPYAYNLARLGITLDYRVVDLSLYQRSLQQFDYDLVVASYGQSQSPGNEQFNYFHSNSADQPGSANLMGLTSPVVDALVERIARAPDRASLVTACQALDRVLLAGRYLVPNWYSDRHRLAWWQGLEHPERLPRYFQAEEWVASLWWAEP